MMLKWIISGGHIFSRLSLVWFSFGWLFDKFVSVKNKWKMGSDVRRNLSDHLVQSFGGHDVDGHDFLECFCGGHHSLVFLPSSSFLILAAHSVEKLLESLVLGAASSVNYCWQLPRIQYMEKCSNPTMKIFLPPNRRQRRVTAFIFGCI